jgi:hypothetical protein
MHRRQVEESNSNYGENLLLFDHLFGTYCGGSYGPKAVGRVRYCDYRGSGRGGGKGDHRRSGKESSKGDQYRSESGGAGGEAKETNGNEIQSNNSSSSSNEACTPLMIDRRRTAGSMAGFRIPKDIAGQLLVPFTSNPLRYRPVAAVLADTP